MYVHVCYLSGDVNAMFSTCTCRWSTVSCSYLHHWLPPTCSAPPTELHKHGTLPFLSSNLHSFGSHPPTAIPGPHLFNLYGTIPATEHGTAWHCWQHTGWTSSHPPWRHTGWTSSHPPWRHAGWTSSHPPRQHAGWTSSNPPWCHTGWTSSHPP